MTLRLAVVSAVVLFGLAGCDRAKAPAPPAGTDAAGPPAAGVETGPAPAPTPTPTPAPDGGAPAFAVLYPGAQVQGAPLSADGAAGPGGLITFTTDASPDQVVAFYRERAEAAGLRSVTGMNQGEARAYGAAGDRPDGPSLQVVAAPSPEGGTSVHMNWSAGS